MVGFVAAIVTYASFVLIVYLFLFGLDMVFLEHIYQAGIVILLCWSVAPLFAGQVSLKKRIRLFIFIILALSMTALYLGEDATKVLFLRIALLTPRVSFSHVPDWSPILVGSIYVVAFLGITLVLLQKAVTSLRSVKNVVYICTFFALAFAPQIIVQNRADALMEYWYQFLLDVRAGKQAPRADVVVLTVATDQLMSNRLETLLTIVDQSSPRIVALVSDDFYGKVRVSRAKTGKRLIIIRQPSVKIDPWDSWSPYARVTLDHGSWFWSASKFSVYYRATNDDVGLKTVLQTTASPGDSEIIQRSANAVAVGSKWVPLTDRGRSIIKYYNRRSILNVGYVEEFESDTLEAFLNVWDLTSIDRSAWSVRKMRFDHKLGRLEVLYSGTVGSPDFPGEATMTSGSLEVTIPELKDKIVLVDYSPVSAKLGGSFGDGFMYANIIQNILQQDFLKEPDRPLYIVSSLLFIAILPFLFRTRSIWQAVAIVLTISTASCAILVAVFMSFSILINPYPILILTAGGVVIFMPALFFWERKTLFEERSRLNAELRTAHDMQMGLMPKEDPVVPGFDVSGICLPANEVGGDFFDYVWLDQKRTRLGIAVADVSGKAMKAAITAVMTSGMIYREVGQNESPKSIMRKINKPMYAKLDSRMFTALSFAMIDAKKKELRFSNAGQAYPVLKRGKEVTPLEVKGARLPLGVKEDVPYGEMVVKLKKGDTVIFYTDGIPEAKNEKDEFYGFDRFKAIAAGIEGASARATRDRILEDVKSFTGKSPQYDDMTVVVVKVIEKPSQEHSAFGGTH